MSNNAAELKVKKLAKLPSNQVCPNCATRSKHGFSTVCVKFHTFVCNNCKSSHQAVSHRCKSLTMSTWTMSEVEELAAKGNDHARRTWLATAPPVGSGGRPTCSTSDLNVFKSFVVNAYERKLYYSNESGSDVQQGPQQSAAPRPTLLPNDASSQPTPEAPVADLLDFSAPPPNTTTATSTTNDDFAFFSADFGDFSTALPPPAASSDGAANGVLLKPPPTSNAASKRGLLPPPPSRSSVPVEAGSTLVTPSFPNNKNGMKNSTAAYMSTTSTMTSMNGNTNGAHAISNRMAPPTTTMMNASGFHPGPTGHIPMMMNGYPQPMNHGIGFQTSTVSMNTGMSMNQSMMNNGMSMNTGMPMNQAMMNAGVNTGMSMHQAMNTRNMMNSSFPQNGFVQQQQQQPPPMMYHAQGMQVTMNMNNSTTTLGTNSNNTNKDHDPFAGLGGF
jgi:hypothetical protein